MDQAVNGKENKYRVTRHATSKLLPLPCSTCGNHGSILGRVTRDIRLLKAERSKECKLVVSETGKVGRYLVAFGRQGSRPVTQRNINHPHTGALVRVLRD